MTDLRRIACAENSSFLAYARADAPPVNRHRLTLRQATFRSRATTSDTYYYSSLEKNFMFPVLRGIENGTIFAELPKVKRLDPPATHPRDLSDWDKIFKH